MPIEIVVSFEDGSSDMYYIPNDLLYGYKSFNDEVYLMEPWNWVSKEYEFEVVGSKKITKVEIDPSKRIADVNQLDNSVEVPLLGDETSTEMLVEIASSINDKSRINTINLFEVPNQ